MAKNAVRGASDSELQQYLQEISRFPLLKAEEEQELARRIAQGDAEARDRMVRSNLRLVVSIAKNYTRRGMSLLDLIEEGNLGLLKAVQRFSPEQGCRFSTYASWWIKQTIRRALINKVKSVRVPAYMFEILGRWRRTAADLAQRLGQEPSPEEIGRVLGLSASKIAAIRQALSASVSVGRGGEDPSYGPEDALAGLPSREGPEDLPEYDREALRQVVDLALTERERKIVEMRYGLGGGSAATLETIGEQIGLTRERVRQIETEALHKLHLFMVQGEEKAEEAHAAHPAAAQAAGRTATTVSGAAAPSVRRRGKTQRIPRFRSGPSQAAEPSARESLTPHAHRWARRQT